MINEVLKKITPTEGEKKHIAETGQKLVREVKGEFKDIGAAVDVNIYGSVSRGTWLAHEKDIDLFVSFPPTFSKEQLEEFVTKVGKKLLKNPEKRFAEHPYVRGDYDGHSVEIIPCYSVEDAAERISAVDRTPFHDEFVKENLKGRQDEVRLLKQFMKGIGCYGAEVKVEGFSGYLCELLVIYYGSFEGVLEGALTWTYPAAVDLKGEGAPAMFPQSPFIFIDPTDSSRNVASAVSHQNLSLFSYAAKTFLENPKETFFFPKSRVPTRIDLLEIFRARGTSLLSVIFQKPGVIDDILYSQLKKANRFLERLLVDHGFRVMNSGFYVGGGITVAFELENMDLPNVKAHTGPTVNSKNEGDFLAKHTGSDRALTRPFINRDRWMVYIKREHTNACALLESFLKNKDLRKKGVPGHIAKAIQRGVEVRVDEEAIECGNAFFADLLDPIFPWEVADDR